MIFCGNRDRARSKLNYVGLKEKEHPIITVEVKELVDFLMD
jgi:hypothetical protein